MHNGVRLLTVIGILFAVFQLKQRVDEVTSLLTALLTILHRIPEYFLYESGIEEQFGAEQFHQLGHEEHRHQRDHPLESLEELGNCTICSRFITSIGYGIFYFLLLSRLSFYRTTCKSRYNNLNYLTHTNNRLVTKANRYQ